MARRTAPTVPMPMPIFAPVSRPLLLEDDEVAVELEVDVGVVVAVAALPAFALVLVAGSSAMSNVSRSPPLKFVCLRGKQRVFKHPWVLTSIDICD